jgi:DNA (cytosine-5)-methyltransferase 1
MIPLRYLSLCSGIEAASTAWHSLGWEPVAFCEIDAFPSAVLAYHWPHVPNLKDMTKWRTWSDDMLAQVDILVGGTPCQAFSVAGLRNSLDDERGNLTLTYAHILDHIDTVRASRGLPPCICLWENVPGVLSTKDNAFGCFLAGLAGEDDALVAPRGKWTNAGYVSGPQRAIAWRTLDAQYFGVAQRRRRVFLVASAGDGFRPEEVLFEREGVRRDSPPSREAGEEITPTIRAGAANGSPGHGQRSGDSRDELIVPCFWNGEQVTQTLDAVLAKGQTMPEKNRFPAVLVPTACAFGGDVARTLSARHDSSPCADRGMDVVAIAENMRGEVRETEYANALTKGGGKPGQGYPAARVAMQVRRLTPTECARLQGFPDDHTKIEWRGRLEEDCPDGPQYKAYGNSMAVPCMAWLGRRITEFGFLDSDRGLYDGE